LLLSSFTLAASIAGNVLALGEEADFEALIFQPGTEVDTGQNV
jgi:hypothetical protein